VDHGREKSCGQPQGQSLHIALQMSDNLETGYSQAPGLHLQMTFDRVQRVVLPSIAVLRLEVRSVLISVLQRCSRRHRDDLREGTRGYKWRPCRLWVVNDKWSARRLGSAVALNRKERSCTTGCGHVMASCPPRSEGRPKPEVGGFGRRSLR
jgi:hypothetical protein